MARLTTAVIGRGSVRSTLRDRHDVLEAALAQPLDAVLGFVDRRLAGQHVIEDAAQEIDVAARIVLAHAGGPFQSGIVDRARVRRVGDGVVRPSRRRRPGRSPPAWPARGWRPARWTSSDRDGRCRARRRSSGRLATSATSRVASAGSNFLRILMNSRRLRPSMNFITR